MDGFGNINWWGYSPCIDLLANHDSSASTDLNVLIVCAGDQRHLLKTISSLAGGINRTRRINFFVYEKMLELYARDLLLLSLSLEHPSRRGVQEKAELFLEIFGNLFVREYTANYVQSRAAEFIKYITDLDQLRQTNLNIFDFDLLKYKERDFLEGIFKFWRLRNQESKAYFPAEKCWEFRLRNYFGTRYDCRSNAYDWDFAMKLIDRKHAAVIHKKIYAKWRDTGVAFELRDSSYDTPNFTLASSTLLTDPRNGDKTGRRGYFGDIIVGPYLAYGIETNDEAKFFKKQNDFYKYTATDIARENVGTHIKSLLELGGVDLSKYQTKEEPLPKLEEISEEGEVKAPQVEADAEEYIKLENVSIKFLPLTVFQDFAQKEKYDKFFDVAYFSNSGMAHMTTKIGKILRPHATVLFETAKFMLELNNEQILAFTDKLRQIGKENDLTELADPSTQDSSNPKLENKNFLQFKSNPI